MLVCAREWEHKLEMGVTCYERGGQRMTALRSVRSGTLQAVSPRITERKWNTLYPWSLAGQLWQGCPSITEYQHLFSPPLTPFSPLLLPLAAVCLCVLCKKHAEKKNREKSGGRVASAYNRLPGDSIEHNEFPEAFIPWFIVWIYRLTYTKDLFAIKQHNNRLYVLLMVLWILSIRLDVAAIVTIYSPSTIIPLSESNV